MFPRFSGAMFASCGMTGVSPPLVSIGSAPFPGGDASIWLFPNPRDPFGLAGYVLNNLSVLTGV